MKSILVLLLVLGVSLAEDTSTVSLNIKGFSYLYYLGPQTTNWITTISDDFDIRYTITVLDTEDRKAHVAFNYEIRRKGDQNKKWVRIVGPIQLVAKDGQTKGRDKDSAFEDVKVQSGFVPIAFGKMGSFLDSPFFDRKNDALHVRHQFKVELGHKERIPGPARKADLTIDLRWWK